MDPVGQQPLVSVITASAGSVALKNCLESVATQTYLNIQHLLFVDGEESRQRVDESIHACFGRQIPNHLKRFYLPFPVGRDRWNGHRMYAAGTFLSEGDYVCFLDDDNFFDKDHIEACLRSIQEGYAWTYSYRKIVDTSGVFQCYDDCESLGRWPSVINDQDYFIDVNCYFLPKNLAVAVAPIWYRRAREPNRLEVDRALCRQLRAIAPNFYSNRRYSLNYRAGNTANSVSLAFFKDGNPEMQKRYPNLLPWKSEIAEVNR